MSADYCGGVFGTPTRRVCCKSRGTTTTTTTTGHSNRLMSAHILYHIQTQTLLDVQWKIAAAYTRTKLKALIVQLEVAIRVEQWVPTTVRQWLALDAFVAW
jgi:hypothetical protein